MYLFLLFIYLAASGLSCSTWDLSLRRSGFSLVVAPGLQSTQAQQLQHAASLVIVHAGSRAHGLSCSVACGILVPQPGMEPASLVLEGGFLTTGPPEKSQIIFLLIKEISLKMSSAS